VRLARLLWLQLAPYRRSANKMPRESTTTSLSESIYQYRKEHGRTYHGAWKVSTAYLASAAPGSVELRR